MRPVLIFCGHIIRSSIKQITMSLERKDIEILEKIVYKNGDDIAVSIARSFERLEERIELLRNDLDSLWGVVNIKSPFLDLLA